MPILRKRTDGGHIIRGFVKAAKGFCTWQLSDAGMRYLRDEGLTVGQRIPSDVFRRLVDQNLAFTGQSGVVEATTSPDFLLDQEGDLSGASHTPKSADKDDLLLRRWLPRLTDRSADVRQKAAEHLGALAVRKPKYRGHLVPLLLDFAVEEEYWHVILNGLFFSADFPAIPKSDAKWLDPFVEAYLEIGVVPGAKQDGGWRELAELVEEEHLKPHHSKFNKVTDVARSVLNAANDDARLHIYAILDWAEDHA